MTAILPEGESMRRAVRWISQEHAERPDVPLAKLLVADSFYREGGSSNLAQADVEYREWLQFFPQHPLADDVHPLANILVTALVLWMKAK